MRQLLYLLLLSVSINPTLGFSQGSLLLNPKTQPQFVHQLPIPGVMDARGGGTFTIPVTEFKQDLGLREQSGLPLLTTVWGYNGTYPGPTIVARKEVPIKVYWPNNLLNKKGKPIKHLLPVDVSLHWALQGVPRWESEYGVPIVTHLHGGQTESASDGLPEAWYTPKFTRKGPHFVKGDDEPYEYSNDQEAATIWYHDHALGITRLNVYAGMAGFYILTDENEEALQAAHKLPAGPYDIGLAIQDRMFTSAGQLFYPSAPPVAGAPNPSAQPEFFGDFILVNGKIWPVLDVEPRQYRFRLLNGSDSRFYNLFLSSGQKFTQIGGDVGLLPAPVDFTQVLIAPGERKDVILDFSDPGLWGKTIIMQNDARTPYPMGKKVDPTTTARIMAFRVTKPFDNTYPATALPASLRDPIPALTTTLEPRKLLLFEGLDNYGRLRAQLGTVGGENPGAKLYVDQITENPAHESTEIWEIYNTTPDAHPIHLHMVKLQILSRQQFTGTIDMVSGVLTNIQLVGSAREPGPEEKGWKDTYVMYPGEVTRIITKFDIEGLAAWHCHILSHEDNDMMRPYYIGEIPDEYMNGMVTKAAPELEKQLQLRTLPNPFNADLKVQLQLPQSSSLRITIYDVTGRRVQQVFSGRRDAGLQQFTVNGNSWSNGTYFCEVVVNDQRMVRKLTLSK